MKNSSVKVSTCLSVVIATLAFFVLFIANSNLTFNLINATTTNAASSQQSSSSSSLSESLQQAQQDLQSSINNQVQRTFTDTISDFDKSNVNATNASITNLNTSKQQEIASSSSINNTETKKLRVGDIDMAYRMFGSGPPLLLIMGSGGTMDEWDTTFLNELSYNHTVIVFDKRGFGLTSFGNKSATISLYANDTAGLIDALGIKKPVDVLGLSLGGFIAQELALSHPEKVDRLVIFASGCSGKIAVSPIPLVETPTEQMKLIAEGIFPDKWKKEHPNYTSYIPIPKVLPSPKSIQSESQSLGSWKGSCDRLSSIESLSLIIVGADDKITPPSYSIEMVQKIPEAWLVQIQDGGHGVMYQYPEKMVHILDTFFETTN